jgi:hypothetical protein
MRLAFALVLAAHGLIHLLGFAKAFAFAELPQLTRPIPPVIGVVWLAAALLFLLAAGALVVSPRWWWAIGACAIAVSTIAILPSWTDAKFGALVNLVALVGVVFGFLAHGPISLRAEYDRDVERLLAPAATADVLTDADLALLPAPVQRYLRNSGVVGQPRVRNLRARMHGRIREGPESRWMPFTAEQHNVFDEPARLFYMDASMLLIPFKVFHRYVGASATMRAKVAALVTVVDMSGLEMTQAETVTLFNDMCIMAPATLVEPAIAWEDVDARTARATFTNAGHTIRAELSFNDAGELTNFRSDDRRRASADGKQLTSVRWSTPVGSYRAFGAVRLASRGEGRWHEPGGEYAYIELEFDEVRYNVRPR